MRRAGQWCPPVVAAGGFRPLALSYSPGSLPLAIGDFTKLPHSVQLPS